nr:hypothetical protein CFP56_48530 [Quercus suber]
MGKGKSKVDGNEVRTGWKDPREVKVYCDLSAVQVLDGKKHQGFFRKKGVDAVIEQLGNRFLGSQGLYGMHSNSSKVYQESKSSRKSSAQKALAAFIPEPNVYLDIHHDCYN